MKGREEKRERGGGKKRGGIERGRRKCCRSLAMDTDYSGPITPRYEYGYIHGYRDQGYNSAHLEI